MEGTHTNKVQLHKKSVEPQNPFYRREGQYVYFGRWQQSAKDESVSITQVVDDGECAYGSNCYTGSDGEIYFKGSKFYESGDVVYYKVEPIKWRILEEKDGIALLLCENIIDFEFFGGENCYAGSMISDWLGYHFYENAFTDAEKDRILLTLVDNSEESTGIENNRDACFDREERVFLLSYKEAFESYGLTDKDRQKVATDYAQSRCGGFGCNNIWYLRSPIPCRFWDWVRGVGEDGKVMEVSISEWFYGGSDGSDGATTGVVPALRIRL